MEIDSLTRSSRRVSRKPVPGQSDTNATLNRSSRYFSIPTHADHDEHTAAKTLGTSIVSEKSTSDRISSTTNPLHARNIVGRYWILEIAASVFSLICLAAIVIVLKYEDGKELDQWGWTISPNVVVSFIGTLAKASIVLVLSQTISQLKWLQFEKPVSLRHLQTFDGASRGPLGAIKLVWYSRRWMASFAAILTVLALFVDPFVQLVLTFPTELVSDSFQHAVFQRTDHYGIMNPDDDPDSYLGASLTIVDGLQIVTTTSLLPELLKSLNQGFSDEVQQISINCQTTNCTWNDPITTLGVCGACDQIDIVDSVCSTSTQMGQYTRHECEYKIPGVNLTDHSNPAITLGAVGEDTHYSWRKHEESTLWNSTAWSPEDGTSIGRDPVSYSVDIIEFVGLQSPYLLTNASRLPTPTIWGCSLRWCMKTIHDLEVRNSIPSFTTTEEPLICVPPNHVNFTVDLKAEMDYKYFLLPKYMNEPATWSTNVHRVSRSIATELDAYLKNVLTVSYGSTPASGLDFITVSGDISIVKSLALSKDVNATIQKVAASLTDVVRTGLNSTYVEGTSYLLKAKIRVRWAWLALPLALSVLASILAVIVAVKSHSHGIPVWKEDPLPLLFHRLDVDYGAVRNDRPGPKDVRNIADGMNVRLSRNEPLMFERVMTEKLER